MSSVTIQYLEQLQKNIIDIDNGLVSIENYKSQELQKEIDKFNKLKAQVSFIINTLEAKEESNKVLDNVLRQAKEAFN
jgi:hypothetical protein|tara:strand:- start:145 stop:378 length:234 start_codon:yes stop_codon:yes gene_type:complete